jgi:hypothetical protein
MKETENAPVQPQLPEIVSSRLQTTYANFCRGLMTAEEIVLDFGFNPNSSGRVVNEPAEVTARVVMSPQSAVRLYQLLHALLAKRQEALQQAQAVAATAGAGAEKIPPPADERKA